MTNAAHRHIQHLDTPNDRRRILAATVVTSMVLGLAWFVPAAQWALHDIDTTSGAGRFEATRDVLAQGWWAIIVATVGLTLGGLLAVALRYLGGDNWPLTAWTHAVRLARTLAVMWMIWIISAFAASGGTLA